MWRAERGRTHPNGQFQSGNSVQQRSARLLFEQDAPIIVAYCQMGAAMAETADVRAKREPAMFYRRIGVKLGVTPLRSDHDLARLVHARLPLASIEALSRHGMSDEEIYSFIIPRRTLVHRKTRRESLTHDESDRAVRMARVTSLAEEVFGDDAKASRWLRKAKSRFDGRSPMEMLRTEAGARLVEEMLLQLDYGFVA
jgi:putative toxin-antitoxin system antitoxin component (TIGR02293 family)